MLKCVWWEVVFWNQLKNRRTCEEWCVCVSCLVMSNSLQPHRLQPTRPHGILQARTLEWVDTSFSTRNYRKKEGEVVQSCPTLYNPMDCSLPGSRIHGIFQERVLEWVAISFSRRMIKHVKCLRPWLAQSKCLMSTYYIIISNGSYSSLWANI